MLQNTRIISKKDFQTDDMVMTYDCAKHCHILCMNYAKGIIFGLWHVLGFVIVSLMCHFLSSVTSKSRKMCAVVGHNGRNGVELSRVIGTFPINDGLM